MFKNKLQGYCNKLFKESKEAGNYPLGVTIRGPPLLVTTIQHALSLTKQWELVSIQILISSQFFYKTKSEASKFFIKINGWISLLKLELW
jgi:hypothetical protein